VQDGRVGLTQELLHKLLVLLFHLEQQQQQQRNHLSNNSCSWLLCLLVHLLPGRQAQTRAMLAQCSPLCLKNATTARGGKQFSCALRVELRVVTRTLSHRKRSTAWQAEYVLTIFLHLAMSSSSVLFTTCKQGCTHHTCFTHKHGTKLVKAVPCCRGCTPHFRLLCCVLCLQCLSPRPAARSGDQWLP